jgi:curved DNA-binding protein CbpA
VSLYEDLGVAPDADETTIKRAYRKRAAKAHPDAGGKREDFERLNEAKLVLLDPRRRQKYDETGETDTAPDNAFAEALNAATAALDHVLGAIERRGADPCSFQIVKDARTRLSGEIEQQQANIKNMDRTIATLQKIADRMKAKPGKPNRLRPVFEQRISERQREKASMKRVIERMKAGYALLGEHEFSADADRLGYY